MKRFIFGSMWAFVLSCVFLVLLCILAGIISTMTLKGTPEEQKVAMDRAIEFWAMPMSLAP